MIALGITACGGTSRAPSSNASVNAPAVASHRSTSGSEFVRQANAICAETKAQLAASLQEAFRAVREDAVSGREGLARQKSDERRIGEAGVAKLAALKPPHGLRSAYSQYLKVQRQRVVLVPSASMSSAAVRHLASQRALVDSTGRKLAKTMGFTSCS
jgi:hypothetical protein